MKNFVIVLVILGAILYFTGNLSNIENVPDMITESFDNISSSMGIKKSSNSNSPVQFTTKRNASYDSTATASSLSPDVIKGSRMISEWDDIFKSNKKVIFYLVTNDSKSQQFDSEVRNFANSLSASYKLVAYEQSYYKNIMFATGSPTSCQTPKECADMRTRANLSSSITLFLDRCGKTMCIINNQKGSVVRLKRRDSAEAKTILTKYKKW